MVCPAADAVQAQVPPRAAQDTTIRVYTCYVPTQRTSKVKVFHYGPRKAGQMCVNESQDPLNPDTTILRPSLFGSTGGTGEDFQVGQGPSESSTDRRFIDAVRVTLPRLTFP